MLSKLKNIGVIIYIALVCYLVFYLITDKLMRQIDTFSKEYSIELNSQDKVTIKSEDGDIYITTPDSISYYLDKDNN